MTPDQAIELVAAAPPAIIDRWNQTESVTRDPENEPDLVAMTAAITESVPVLVTPDTLAAATVAAKQVEGEPFPAADWTTPDTLVRSDDGGTFAYYGGCYVFGEPIRVALTDTLQGSVNDGTAWWERRGWDVAEFVEEVDMVSWSTITLTNAEFAEMAEASDAFDVEDLVFLPDGSAGAIFIAINRFGRRVNDTQGLVTAWDCTGVGFLPTGVPLRQDGWEHTAGDVWGYARRFVLEHGAWPVVAADLQLVSLLHTLNALAGAEVVETVPATVSRPARRRAERAGGPSKLRLMQLPHRVRIGAEGSEDANPINWSHRWWVRPHWRTLHRGTADERRVRVKGYVKGPDDQPFVAKDILGRL